MTARDRTVVMVIGMLVIVGAFWFLLIGPRHKAYSTAADAASTAQSRKDAAEESVAKAEVAKKSYPADYSQISQLGKAVPVDDEVPSLVYQLSSTADNNDIDFRSIKLGASTAAAPAAVPPPAATGTAGVNGGTAGGGTTSTSATTATTGASATSTPAATDASSVAAATLPPGASIGTAGFPTMPFNFTFDGSFFDMSDFLQDVDRYVETDNNNVAVRGRLLGIDGIVVNASRDGFPQVRASLAATAFLLPADEGLTDGGTATAPAAPDATTAGSTSSTPPTAATGAK